MFFRDYARYDLAQIRFMSRKTPSKIDECMYVRWDGTTSYFFTQGMQQKTQPFLESLVARNLVLSDICLISNMLFFLNTRGAQGTLRECRL